MRLLRWMRGKTMKDKMRNECIQEHLEVDDKLRDPHLLWFGHVGLNEETESTRRDR